MNKDMKKEVFIISGMSGAGKSTALNFLEDYDFEIVDNLPLNLLIPSIHESNNKYRLAFGIDIRTRDFNFKNFNEKMRNLISEKNLKIKIIFLECNNFTLLRRYKESRRPHPLGKEKTLHELILKEREMLNPIKNKSDIILDTSDLIPYDLKSILLREIENTIDMSMNISLYSFGYKIGIPEESDLVIDVRFIKNPFYVHDLKKLSGLDKEVKEYIINDPFYPTFIKNMKSFLELLIPKYEQEGKSYLTISFGCTGGQHRSVCVAEEIGQWLNIQKIKFNINHRDLPSKG